MTVNLTTQVRPTPELFRPDAPLREQINDILVETAEISRNVECDNTLADLNSQFAIATSLRLRYVVLQAEVQRLRDQVVKLGDAEFSF
jgi:hypothetical protein